MSIELYWNWIHKMTEKDKEFLAKPIMSKFWGFKYGIYCGPLTNKQYDKWYKENDPRGDPIDALDFLCLLHDRYFLDERSDNALLQSIQILI